MHLGGHGHLSVGLHPLEHLLESKVGQRLDAHGVPARELLSHRRVCSASVEPDGDAGVLLIAALLPAVEVRNDVEEELPTVLVAVQRSEPVGRRDVFHQPRVSAIRPAKSDAGLLNQQKWREILSEMGVSDVWKKEQRRTLDAERARASKEHQIG